MRKILYVMILALLADAMGNTASGQFKSPVTTTGSITAVGPINTGNKFQVYADADTCEAYCQGDSAIFDATHKISFNTNVDFNDSVRIRANAGAGKVFTSDANGYGFWTAPSASVAGQASWVQYNYGNELSADSNFVWDRANFVFSVGDLFNQNNSTRLLVEDNNEDILLYANTIVGTGTANDTYMYVTPQNGYFGDVDGMYNYYFLQVDNITPKIRLNLSDGHVDLKTNLTNDTIIISANKAVRFDSLTLPITLTSGTYTPIPTDSINATGIIFTPAQYMQVGNVVTVSGHFSFFATVAGIWGIHFSIPLSAGSVQYYECAGTASSFWGAMQPVESPPINFLGTPADAAIYTSTSYSGSHAFAYQFTYHIN